MQISTQVFPNQAPQQLLMNGLRVTWIYCGSDNSCCDYTEVAELERSVACSFGCSVLEVWDSLGWNYCSTEDWPTDIVAPWTNWYICPLPTCPKLCTKALLLWALQGTWRGGWNPDCRSGAQSFWKGWYRALSKAESSPFRWERGTLFRRNSTCVSTFCTCYAGKSP